MLHITTNNVPRLIIDDYELTTAERSEFDYLHWDAIDAGEDSASFVRYKGRLYDLGEFMRSTDPELNEWDGYSLDTFFSGMLIRICRDDNDRVIVAQYYSS
jgi:hypothetical protein